MDLSHIADAGANISSVIDYAKYLKMYIRKSGPLSEEAHKELRTQRAITTRNDEDLPTIFAGPQLYALSWLTRVFAA